MSEHLCAVMGGCDHPDHAPASPLCNPPGNCWTCGVLGLPALRKLYADRDRKRVRPPKIEGHPLWRVASVSSIWFYRAPDKATAAKLSRRYGRALKGKNLAKRATYADIGLLLGTLDQKSERENA